MPIDPTKVVNLSKAQEVGKELKAQLSSIEDRPDLVTVGFEGLGICCFAEAKTINLSNQTSAQPIALNALRARAAINVTQTPARGEIAIIRKPAPHFLTLAVFETTDGKSYQLHSYPGLGFIKYGFNDADSLHNNLFPLPDDLEISVAAVQNPGIAGYAKYKPLPTINRQIQGAQDTGDLGWLVDIEGDGFHNKKLVSIKSNTKLSTMYIHNAEFYTRSFLKKGENDPTPQPQTLNGQNQSIIIGHEIGAKIPADRVRLTVKSQSKNINDVFEFGAGSGKRYLIKVGNTCTDNSASLNGDFDAIYEFLREAGNNPTLFSLTPKNPPLKTTVPQIPTKPLPPKPDAHAYVRFCGAYLAGKQDGIGELLATQALALSTPPVK